MNRSDSLSKRDHFLQDINLPIFSFFFLGYKLWYKTKMVSITYGGGGQSAWPLLMRFFLIASPRWTGLCVGMRPLLISLVALVLMWSPEHTNSRGNWRRWIVVGKAVVCKAAKRDDLMIRFSPFLVSNPDMPINGHDTYTQTTLNTPNFSVRIRSFPCFPAARLI